MDGTIILQYAKEIYFPSALLDGYFCALSAVLLQRLHFNCPALCAQKVCVGWAPALAKIRLVTTASNSVYQNNIPIRSLSAGNMIHQRYVSLGPRGWKF